MRNPEKNEHQSYRFRNRLPQPGEGKLPRAELNPQVSNGVAVIRLYDVIDSWGGFWGVSASEFADTLDGLDSDVNEIRLHINSPGGEVFEAVAILNQLRNHSAKVVAIVDGLAASAASFIAAGADELIMGENSQLMIHDAWGICVGNAADMRDLGERLDHLSDNIAAIYAAKTSTEVPGWRAAMLAETWYSADEAVDSGLADRAGAVDDEDEAATVPIEKDDDETAFDAVTSGFKFSGRSEAPDPSKARVPPLASATRDRRQELRARQVAIDDAAATAGV